MSIKPTRTLAYSLIALFLGTLATFLYVNQLPTVSSSEKRPVSYEEEESYDEEKMQLKMAPWSPEAAARQQAILEQYQASLNKNKSRRTAGGAETFGTLKGTWTNRAPRNMPGAFKFAEMLDGTDTIYGVSHNHYSGEYNAKSYIYRGTIYNPATGKGGDDFVRLTGNWPNRYTDLIAYKYNGKVRLIAGVENGPVYYSDDQGQTWTKSSGLSAIIQSTILNRQDGLVYSTDGTSVFVSSDGGVSFSPLQNFGSSGDMVLYSPRYNIQPNAEKVYLARNTNFYELNTSKTNFDFKGSFGGASSFGSFSIGGDSRRLYVTKNNEYYVSTDGGLFWSVKYPKGNWYGDRTGKMSAGMKICINPEDPLYVIGGYAQPVFSKDGLETDNSTTAGWGNYQNGLSLSAAAYYDRIRFNYHPDFQASHFFYNANDSLFIVSCTDGGLYISYKVWKDHPTSTSYDNSGFSSAHFINVTTLNIPIALVYRQNMFTGKNNPDHIMYSTQDQGSGDVIPGSSGTLLDVYQGIGGDGPPLNSADGNWVWKWQREGKEVWAPAEIYDGSGNKRTVGTINGLINNNASTTFTKTATVGWVQTYIDHDQPDQRIWILGRSLDRATVSGSTISGYTVNKGGTKQIAGFAQAHTNPDRVYFLQDGKVYKSSNRGDTFDNGTTTPFSITSNNQCIGAGWVNPTDDNWILFAGPSGNSVGAILSKDGGSTWTDVTGNFQFGDDFQVGGMVGTPDGKYVFAGTDVGPFVFEVATEQWYPMFGGQAAMFNTTAIEYIASTKTVRFGAWGSGVWDFSIDDGSPSLNLEAISSTNYTCDSLILNWTSNQTGPASLVLKKGGTPAETFNLTAVEKGRFAWFIPSSYPSGSDYSFELTVGGISKSTSNFTIAPKEKTLGSNHLTVSFVDSEHNSSRLASNTIDGDPTTFWHTEWSPGNPAYPHSIIYSLDTVAEWTSFTHLPRQDGSANGRIKDYKVYGKDGSNNWILLKAGTLSNQASAQTVLFDQSLSTSEIKFEALSEQSGAFYASMAEFQLSYKVSCQGTVTSVQDDDPTMEVYPTLLKSGGDLNLLNARGLVQVISIQGQVIRSIQNQESRFTLSTKDFPVGTYIINCEGRQRKIVIQ